MPDYPPYAQDGQPDQGTTPEAYEGNALAQAGRGVWSWLQQQRAKSAAMGFMDPATGLPTRAGILDAARQYGNALMLGTSAPESGAITAYHGSPYSFERFDPAKIGTGEGAQAYGHGLYFAESEPVAKSYRDALARTDYSTSTGGCIPDWVGNSIKQIGDQFGTDSKLYGQTIDRHIDDFQGRLAQSQKDATGDVQPWLAKDRAARQQDIIDSLQSLRSGDATLLPRGSMYQVNLQADPEHFLDWDKPISEQSGHVYESMRKAGLLSGDDLESQMRKQLFQRMNDKQLDEFDALQDWHSELTDTQHNAKSDAEYDHALNQQRMIEHWWDEGPSRDVSAASDPTGQSYVRQLGERFGSPADAAQKLRDAGIPGIRYLDQGSRGASQGSSNYVVFNPDIIDIIRRYGIAGLIGGGAAAAAGGGQQPQP